MADFPESGRLRSCLLAIVCHTLPFALLNRPAASPASLASDLRCGFRCGFRCRGRGYRRLVAWISPATAVAIR
jgi:hypothetical protein